MILGAKIKNFQKHKNLKLSFTKGVNVIVGPTDCGKSSIVRSLVWCLRNTPGGIGFKAWGTDEVEVKIRLSEKVTLTRKKSSKENQYQLGDELFEAFGAKVPDPIQDFLCINKINIHQQHDNEYWFGESAGEVSRQLNEIIDLGVIDVTLKETHSLLKRRKSEFAVTEGRLLKAKEALDDLSFIEVVKEKWDVVLEAEGVMLTTRQDALQLAEGIGQLHRHRERGKRAGSVVQGGGIVVELGEGLVALNKTCLKLEEKLDDLHDLQETLKQEDVVKQMQKSCTLLGDVLIAYKESKEQCARLGDCIQSCETLKQTITEKQQILEELKEELKLNSKGVCPLCGSEVEHEH